MKNKISKIKLIQSIIDYVFNTYCDDEQIALFAQDYYELEKRAEERKARKSDTMISKSYEKIFKITRPVRDFLEPLVDAEYFKNMNYIYNVIDNNALYLAMEQLETRQYDKLLKEIKAEELD